MHARKSFFNPVFAVMAAACFAALNAQAAESTFPQSSESTQLTPAQASQPAAPSANNEKFKQLRTTCETEVASGKASGDICVEAAMLLVGDPQRGDDLPDAYRDVKEDLRIKMALRLLERGVDSSNLARARAYDWYDKVGFLGMSPYADPYRAQELMDMMIKSGYAGGILRKIRGNTSIIAFGASDTDKKDGCATAKKMLGGGKLDADSAAIAKEVVGSGICLGFEQNK
jgi:hypothetical protein